MNSHSVTATTRADAGAAFRWWQRWPEWVGYATAAWSLAYGLLGLYWTLGGAGFPFGANDPQAQLSVFSGLRRETGAPVIALLGLVGAVAAITMAQARGRGVLRTALLGLAWIVATVLTLVVPDYRVLVTIAYLPIFLIGAPFGFPPGASFFDFFDALTWPVINQFIFIFGGFLWAATAIAYRRWSTGACGYCGRSETNASDWTSPAAAARWGKWATAIAVGIPIAYAVTRWAWALGIPLGISEEFLREGQATGLWWAGAALATLAVGGALLTLGLIQRWGEIFPRWLPLVGGKRVPSALAIIPASLVAVMVTSAGLMFIRMTLAGTLPPDIADNWAAIAPELLWPLWGLALGAATLGYYYRRRGRCPHCRRG